MRRLCQLLALVLCGMPCLVGLPDWSATSWLGGCWGAVLLTGLSATWARHRSGWCLYCVVICGLAHASMSSLTDFGRNATWLLIAMPLTCGWLMGISLVPWSGQGRTPGKDLDHSDRQSERYRFSAWDVACATALVGLLCATIPNVENQFDLMCQVGPAMVGGIVLSTLALQWAWKDNWSLSNLAVISICLVLSTLLILPWSGMERGLSTILTWVIAGPLSVMAAQFILVLAWSATLRQPRPASHSQRLTLFISNRTC